MTFETNAISITSSIHAREVLHLEGIELVFLQGNFPLSRAVVIWRSFVYYLPSKKVMIEGLP